MEDDPVEGVIKLCTMTQRMIDITGKQLDCLRTQCKTTEEITQKEIKEAEVQLKEQFYVCVIAMHALAMCCFRQCFCNIQALDSWQLPWMVDSL